MAVLIPTKTIPQLTAYGVPLAGAEQLEIWATGTSRRITTRDFALPIDSLITVADQGSVLPGSRQLVSSATVQVNDGGAGGQVSLDVLLTGALPGNPTAQVGLAAINGVAVTWMRSDAAPALNQTIAPTWTDLHTFSKAFSAQAPAVLLSSSLPAFQLNETDAAVDNRRYSIFASGEQLNFSLRNDADSGGTSWMTVDRTGTTVDAIALVSTALTWNGNPLLSTATAFANPTASVGLVAVNGVATTAMRSDAAPALDQGIAPTWTGTHTFTNASVGILISSTSPGLRMSDTDAGVDSKLWLFDINAGNFRVTTRTDAGAVGATALQINRTGTTVDSVAATATTITLTGMSRLFGSEQLFGASTFSARAIGVTSAQAQMEGNSNSTSSLSIVRNNASSGGGIITLGHSRAGAAGGVTIVSANDSLGSVEFAGADGVDLVSVAGSIVVAVDATPGADDMPGRMVFNTTADGAASPTERFRISSAGAWGIAGANFGTAGQIFTSGGAAAAPSWSTPTANPTATVGLTAVNGTAITFMRSDAAPALSQAIAPTWTAQHTFSLLSSGVAYPIFLSSNLPGIALNEADGAANNRLWDFIASSEQLSFRARTDDGVTSNSWVTVDRTGAVIDTVNFPPTVVFANSSAAIRLESTAPRIYFDETDAPANESLYRMAGSNGDFFFETRTDADGAGATIMSITRTGTTVDSVAFPTQASAAFLIGTTSSLAAGNVAQVSAAASQTALLVKCTDAAQSGLADWNAATAGDNTFVSFYTEAAATLRGSITYNRGGGLVAYNTTSDARRKKNIRDSNDSGDVIDRIKVRAFDWNESDTHVEYWFVAQELHTVMPMAVAVGSENRDWAIDPSKLVPLLVKEVQELRRRVQQVETNGAARFN